MSIERVSPRAIPPRLSDRLAALPDRPWRSDASVPPFPEDKPVIVFDGVCVLCSGFARFVAQRDRAGRFRFAAAQSPLGVALYRHLGLDPVNYESNLLIADGRVFAKMEAFVEIMRRLGGAGRVAGVLAMLPGAARDRLYDAIAANRYRMFGVTGQCMRPDARMRERMLE